MKKNSFILNKIVSPLQNLYWFPVTRWITQWMLTDDYEYFFFFIVISDEVQWSKGKVSGAVYWGDEKLTDLLVKVLGY